MPEFVRRLESLALRLLTVVDGLANRLYTQRFNPLYQSGTIVVALYLVILVSGLWLILFYRVGSPWESVARLTASPWTGNWVRGVHRYASDLAVVATAVHAFRMFAQGRSWGPRALAWVSGCALLFLVMLCGWTGYVMVWDTFGLLIAREGARILDALPLLSEPTSRAFTGEGPVPAAFFFLTLFAHIGIPLGMAVIFWLHVKRVARPRMLPPRGLVWGIVGALVAAAVVWPLEMAPRADALLLPREVPADLFYAFWIPVTRHLAPSTALLLWMAVGLLLVAVPPVVAFRRARPAASHVDEDICVGCVQCSLDCPYEAIAMVEREEGRRSALVARVDPDLCVSCGICAGSCPPMGVGPPGRAGRDQLVRVRGLIPWLDRRAATIVVIGCEQGAGAAAAECAAEGAVPYPVDCLGSLHSSVVEHLLRAGAGGVLILSCPPRDCHHRDGARWLTERLYHGREAELQARVDRARVRVAHVNGAERDRALAALREFAGVIRRLGPLPLPERTAAPLECDRDAAGVRG
jgi:coenzyme F420-reducing hydrogenase delta subunit/ferredoxin